MTSLYELYQAYQPDYDIFDVANQSQLVLFTEKFEHMVEDLEGKMAQIARGNDPYAAAAAEGKSTMQLSFSIAFQLLVQSS